MSELAAAQQRAALIEGVLEQAQLELPRARTKGQKLQALLRASDGMQAVRCKLVQHVAPGISGGEALAADHAVMQRAAALLNQLAHQHGLLDELQQALHAAAGEGAWGSGLDGAPLEKLTCANIDVASHSVCRGPARLACRRCRLAAYCSKE